MLLKIVDRPKDGEDDIVELIFESNTDQLSFKAEYYPSPLSSHLQKDLGWYFTHYLSELDNPQNDRSVSERILNLGRYMGNQLLGEDHELTRIKEWIEDQGHSKLEVEIHSSRAKFFAERWEALVLPDDKYVLAAVCRCFSRIISLPKETTTADGELVYELDAENPLTVLHVVSRLAEFSWVSAHSQSMRTFQKMNCLDGGVRYEIVEFGNANALLARLADTENPVHILHFDGPVQLADGQSQLIIAAEGQYDTVAVNTVATTMHANRVAILSIDAQGYFDSAQKLPVESEVGIHWLASEAHAAGIGNIIGANNLCFAEVGSQCFSAIYSAIAQGFEVGQAVVEARKSLQSQTETHLYDNAGKPFHCWSLPLIYSTKSCQFFKLPLRPSQAYESSYYHDLRQRMFGFKDDFIPPKASMISDSSVPNMLLLLEQGLPVFLGAGQGTGKTLLGHQLAYYLGFKKVTKFSFYFDFAEGFYSVDEIKQMLEPIITEDELQKTTCLFFFDNLDQLQLETAGPTSAKDLLDFIGILTEQGHPVLLVGQNAAPPYGWQGVIHLMATPSALVQQCHWARALKSNGIDKSILSNAWLKQSLALHGNPFLIEKIAPMLADADADAEALLQQLAANFDNSDCNHRVDEFFGWQWQQLNDPEQRLIIVLYDLPDVLLELIELVANKEIKPNPVHNLLECISAPDLQFSKAIKHFQNAGLLRQLNHGRVVSPRFKKLVQAQRETSKELSQVSDQLPLLLSKVVGTGLAAITPHIQSQPDNPIKQYLLLNRGTWARHLEELWRSRALDVFMPAKGGVFALMKQEGLSAECAAWCHELITSEPACLPAVDYKAGKMPEFPQLVWLNLAGEALQKQVDSYHPVLAESATAWGEWLEKNRQFENPAVFVPVIQFVESFRFKTFDWAGCLEVGKIAYEFYQKKEIWPKFMESARMLMHCCYQMNDFEQAEEFQEDLLVKPSFEKLMPGQKEQLLLEIASIRLGQDQVDGAQAAIDQLKQSQHHMQLEIAIKNIQAEIYVKQNKSEEALVLFEQIKQVLSEQGQQEALKQIEKRLATLQAKA